MKEKPAAADRRNAAYNRLGISIMSGIFTFFEAFILQPRK